MSEPLRIVKRKFLVSLAEGDPVPTVLYEAARTKRPAKATEEWKPCPCRCSMCGKGKMFRSQKCPHCVEHNRWSAKNFDWRAPLDTAPCHCGQSVLTCGCVDEKSPKHSHIQYEEDGLSGWPVQEHEIDYELDMMTYKQMMRRVRDKLETLLAHWGPDADIIALDDRFDESGAAGGDVINLVSSDDEKEAGMSP